MTKRFLLYTYILLLLPIVLSAQSALQDSLQNALGKAISEQAKIETLTNLMDISKGDDILKYGKQVYAEALRMNNDYYKEAALAAILRQYVNTDQKDSANLYLAEAERSLKGESKTCLVSYMRMILDTRVVSYTTSEERLRIIKEYMVALETDKSLSPYQVISYNYVVGMAVAGNLLIGFNVMADTGKNELKEAKFYFLDIVKIVEKMPIRQAYYFLPNIYFMLCNLSNDSNERAQYATAMLNLIKSYANENEMKRRPYAINKRHLLNAYTNLAISTDAIGKDLGATYYHELVKLLKQYPEAANITPEYEYYFTSANYYYCLRDFKRYIQFNDSLIEFFKGAHYENEIISCVTGKIAAYDSLGMYKEAYENYKDFTILQDSANARILRQKLEGLEIQESVNNLVVEKRSLELDLQKAKNQNYLFLALSILALGGLIFIFFRLGKMKSLYRELRESNQKVLTANRKAMESEEMKTAFIRNMSHEIRTPLNAINGFSELIADDSVSTEEKKAFSQIIHDNCFHLTTMLNSLLEIAQLDGTSDTFPLTPIHIKEICEHEIEQAKKFRQQPDIEYRLNGDPDNDMVLTNRTYFSLVLSHLLANSSKFTEKGSITIAYRLDNGKNQATFTITDTGCGIPADKQEWIFERFTKANNFVPGSGLGLYLCRLILKRLNGKIKVDSTYTDGARLVITMPIATPGESTK